MNLSTPLLILLLGLGTSAKAATILPPPDMPEPDRSIPVPPGPQRPFQVPPVQESRLKNGMKLVLDQAAHGGLVSLSVLIPTAGSIYDPKDKTGLAGITASLMTEGAGRYDSRGIAEEFADIGRTGVDIKPTDDALSISLTVSKQHLGKALRLISAILQSPRLPAQDLERVKEETVAEIQSEKGNPGILATTRLSQRVFGNDPYGRYQTEQSVQSITRDDVVAFHRADVTPDGAILAVGGDVSLSEAVSVANQAFGNWRGSKKENRPSLPVLSDQNPTEGQGLVIDVIDMPGSPQSAIRAGHLTGNRGAPDFFATKLMNIILGMVPHDSRLERNIREQHQWAYGAGSSISPLKRGSILTIETDVRTDATAPAIVEILKEMARLQNETVPAEELEAAKKLLSGMFVMHQQTTEHLVEQAADAGLYDLDPNFYANYRDKVAAVTPADVQAAARKHLHPDQLQIVISGDAAKIAGPLSRIAPVRVFDVDGNPKRSPITEGPARS